MSVDHAFTSHGNHPSAPPAGQRDISNWSDPMKATIVLVAPDSRFHQETLDYLENTSHFTITKFNKIEPALNHLHAHPQRYSALLVDLVLGNAQNNPGTLRKFRPVFTRLPVIVLTDQESDVGVEALRHGAYTYMSRPLDYLGLEILIRGLAEQKALLIRILQEVGKILKPDVCIIWRPDRRRRHLCVAACSDSLDEEYQNEISLDPHRKAWRDQFRKGKPIVIRDLADSNESPWYSYREEAKKRKWRSLISIPLVHADRIIGVIDSYFSSYRHQVEIFGDDMFSGMLHAYATSATEAIRHADLAARAQTLHQLGRNLNESLPENAILRHILFKAVELVDANHGRLYLLDSVTGHLELRASVGEAREESTVLRDAQERIAQMAHAYGRPYILSGALESDATTSTKTPRRNSEIAVPLRRGEQILGVLTVISDQRNAFTEDDTNLLLSLAAHAAGVVDRTKLTKYLREISQQALEEDSGSLARSVVSAIRDLTGAEVNLWLVSTNREERGKYLRMAANSGQMSEDFVSTARLPIDPNSSLTGHALSLKQPVIRRNILKDPGPPHFYFVDEAKRHNWKSCMIVPLLGRETETLGAINLYSTEIARFSQAEIDLIKPFASQIATNLQQQQRAQALQHLAHVGQALTEGITDDLKALLKQVAEVALALSGADCTVLYPYDFLEEQFYREERIAAGELKHPLSRDDAKPRKQGLAALTRKLGRLVVHNVDEEEFEVGAPEVEVDENEIIQLIRNAAFIQREGIKALAGLSLRAVERGDEDGTPSQVVGILYINFRTPYRFTREILQILRIYSHQVANVIRGARLFNQAQRQMKELEAVHQTALKIIHREDLKSLLSALVEEAARLLQASGGRVYLRVRGRDEVRLEAAKNVDSNIHPIGSILPFGKGAPGTVIRDRKPLIINDYDKWEGALDELKGIMFSVVDVPLVLEQEAIGVLSIFNNKDGRRFSRRDLPVLQRLAQQASLAIHHATFI